MKAKFQMKDPDKAVYRIEIEMTLGDWKELQDQLQKTWPSWQLSNVISSAVHQAEKNIYLETEE